MRADHLNAFLDYPDAIVPNAENGPLAGMTLAVKDLFDVAGYRTGCGNPVKLEEASTARTTNSAVQKLLDAGARFIGKTQTEELAFSLIGQNVHFPHPVNPRAPGRVTGGSSSGSAAAVAGGLVDIAIGSDTGGSIRVPASFCGLIGLRTTHGAIPLDHTMPLAPSFDTFGWFARDMVTYRKVAEILLPAPSGPAPGANPAKFLRSPDLEALLPPETRPEYERCAGLIAEAFGAAQTLPPPPFSLDELYWSTIRLQAREAWAAHGAWIESGDRRLAPAIYDRFLFGRTVTDTQARADLDRRTGFTDWLGEILSDNKILILPTVTEIAPEIRAPANELLRFREKSIPILCWAGLGGFPQVTLPIGEAYGGPLGLSLLGSRNSDLGLLDLGSRLLSTKA